MKAALFYYDDFAQFEVSLALLQLAEAQWHHIGLENRPYKSLEGQTFALTHTLNQTDPTQLDLLLIPGGDSRLLFDNLALRDFVVACLQSGGMVAGICGGAELLAGLGLLKGRRCTGGTSGIDGADPIFAYFKDTLLLSDHVVVESVALVEDFNATGTLITAQGQAYAELAAKLYHLTLGKDTGENEQDTLQWLKNIRPPTSENSPPSLVTADSQTFLVPAKGWTEVSRHVKVSTGDFEQVTCTVICSKGEAIVVDTGYEVPETVRILKYLEALDLTLKGIIITHHHEDHNGNLGLFEHYKPKVWDVNNTCDGDIITLGDLHLEILHTPGHSPITGGNAGGDLSDGLSGDLSVCVKEEQILIAGDILFSCLPPMLCYGGNPQQLIQTLRRLQDAHYQWIVPGHGYVQRGDAMTQMALDYVDKLYQGIATLSKDPAILNEPLNPMHYKSLTLNDCIDHYDWMAIEPALDLHRQNIEEHVLKRQPII